MTTLSPTTNDPNREKILNANRAAHAREGTLYLARHPEQSNFYQTRLRSKALDEFSKMALPGGNLLDLGCGTGYLTLPLLERGFQMTAVDLSPAMIEALAARLPKDKLTDCRLRVEEAGDFLRREEALYDGATLSALLHHLYDYEEVIEAICARLKPGAPLLIYFEPLKDAGHSPAAHKLHRALAALDETVYRLEMRWRGIPLLDEEYVWADYQRRFGGIDFNRLETILKKSGMEILRVEKFCARRYGWASWIANRILKTPNTFSLLARRATPGQRDAGPSG